MFDPAQIDSSLNGETSASLVTTTTAFPADMQGLAEALFRETGDALILFEPDTGRILEVNPTAQRLSGFTRDELLTMETTHVLQAESTESRSRLKDAQQHTDSFHARDGFVLRTKTVGSTVPVNLTITRLHLIGRTLGLITVRDVREQREAYNRLKKIEAEMRRVLQSVSDCLWSARLDGRGGWSYRYFSPVVESITGRSAKFFVEKEGPISELRWRWIVDPRDLDRWQRFIGRMRDGLSSQEEYRVLRPNGQICWVRESVRVSPASDSRSLLLDGVISDVTERKRADEELRAAKDAAIAANRAKSEFLAHMSHEIRTPLNGILGMAEVLSKTELNSVQSCYLEVLHGSASSLLTIINDILDFSKIEARKLELEHAPFSLREVLSDALNVVAVRAHQKRLELSLHVHSGVPDGFVGDANRLRQVILNLVNNAVKFTERGEIDIHVESTPSPSDASDRVALHFSVRDTGIGIPPDKHDLVFEAFAQVDPSSTRKYGGTGLGLCIASQLVQRMHGRIWAESELGIGSTFHFTALLERNREPTPTERQVSRFRPMWNGKRVLAVEDHASGRALIQDLLTKWGLDAVIAADATQGAAAYRDAKAEHKPFDLLLIDGNLEQMDDLQGLFPFWQEWTRGERKPPTTILLLNAANLGRDVDTCRRLGVEAYLTKPIRESTLLEVIAKLLLPAAQPAIEAAPPPPPPSPHSMRILLVEDNAVNQLFAATVLEQHGHRVTVAKNAAEALGHIDAEQFDVALMDIEMPDMDGFAATSAIRARERERGGYLPIVAVTAHALKGFRERCLEAGMDDYLSKPVASHDLLSAVQRCAALAVRPR